MTEEEWLRCTDVQKMIMFFHKRGSGRKWRLLAVACCISHSESLDERCLVALDVVERFADGLANEKELMDAHRSVEETALRLNYTDTANPFMAVYYATLFVTDHSWTYDADIAGTADRTLEVRRAVAFAEETDLDDERSDALSQLSRDDELERRVEQESKTQSVLLREIFGNPFQPAAIDRRWLTSNVVDLSKAIYEQRSFKHLPILADALMDGGCDNEEILNHCRSTSPHVRGCWVVDLLTGRS